MTVLIPYVAGMRHRRTKVWGEHHGAVQWQLDLDDHAYWKLLADSWAMPVELDPGDLVIVEQDIVPASGVVKRMLRCTRPWCVSPYPISNGTLLDSGLGCTKFATRLKTRHPDLMERVGEIADDGLPAKNWRRLDTRIARVLRELGYRPHRHAVSEHQHDYARRP